MRVFQIHLPHTVENYEGFKNFDFQEVFHDACFMFLCAILDRQCGNIFTAFFCHEVMNFKEEYFSQTLEPIKSLTLLTIMNIACNYDNS